MDTKEQLTQLTTFEIEKPLDAPIPAATAELFVCQSSLYPGEKLILKLARPGFEETIRKEGEDIRRLHDAQVPYVINLVAAGSFPSKENRYGLVEKYAKGRPLGVPKTAAAYEITTHTKIEALKQYLDFLTLAYEKGNFAKVDHQVEATFWDPESRVIQVVDFTPLLTSETNGVEFEVIKRTVPQLVEFFADAFGCSTPQELNRPVYAVDADEVMPPSVLNFYTDLCNFRPLDAKVGETHLRQLYERFSTVQQGLTVNDLRRVELNRLDLRIQAIRDGLLVGNETL